MEASRKDPGTAWLTFAGVLFIIAGAANVIWGIAAIDGKDYLPESSLLFGTLDFWGGMSLVWGLILLGGSYLLLSGSAAGVGAGTVLATLSAVFWFFLLPTLPIFALTAILVDGVIIYGLVHYGEAQHI